MRSLLLPLPLLLTSCVLLTCTLPTYEARRTVDLRLPAAELARFVCTSHNGTISVTGDPAIVEVEVRAELSVRGWSQGEADDNLNLMSVGHERQGGTLRVFGHYPQGALDNLSPSFAFTVRLPRQVALELESHNGDLVVRGTAGDQRCTTHNGGIDAQADGRRLGFLTHNGRIGVDVTTAGPVDGTFESHNGEVDVAFGPAASATLTAGTHNGGISAGERLRDVRLDRSTLRARIGDGEGRVAITTHNGDVRVR
ncbi:MAG: DUF4097 domain-containing protein [Planctomycetes bacterium]|nr:DUF4097 domain-containing protein [Planctomycetota bacterium]